MTIESENNMRQNEMQGDSQTNQSLIFNVGDLNTNKNWEALCNYHMIGFCVTVRHKRNAFANSVGQRELIT